MLYPDETNRRPLLAIVTNVPTPYRIPLFNVMQRKLDMIGYRLVVIFGAPGYDRRFWTVDLEKCTFPYVILGKGGIRLNQDEKFTFTYHGLIRTLIKLHPSAVICSGFSLATTKLWLISWFKPLKYLIWSGATFDHRDHRRKGSILREIHRRLLINKAAGFIAYGTRAMEYLVSLGAEPRKIDIGINTVETEYFKREVGRLKKENKHLADKNRLLYVGHLTARKGVESLLDVASFLSRKRSDFVIDIVGDGPEKEQLQHKVIEKGLSSFVKFHGYKQKSELPQYMARSCCFLFPTHFDIWGLVLIEAMAAGLPCIASIYAGAVCDLILSDLNNGFVVDFSKINDVTEKIEWILDHPKEAEQVGLAAKNFIVDKVSLNQSIDGFILAFKKVLT